MRGDPEVQSDLISSSDWRHGLHTADDDVICEPGEAVLSGTVGDANGFLRHVGDVECRGVSEHDEAPGSSFLTYSGRKHKVYTDEFKKCAVIASRGSSFKAAAGKLKIDPKTLAAWKKSIQSKKAQAEQADAEDNVIGWLTELARSGQKVELQSVADKLESCGDWRQNIQKPNWFIEWAAKISPVDGLSFPLDSRVQFPFKFKAVVAQLAKSQTHASLANALCISRKQIYTWVKDHDCVLLETARNSEKTGRRYGVETVKQEEAEKKLFSWFTREKAHTGCCPKYSEVKRKARALFSASGFPRLRCSYGWFIRWKARYSVEELKHPLDESLVAWVLAQYDSNSSMTLTSFLKNAGSVLQRSDSACTSRESIFAKDWAVNFAKRNTKFLQLPGYGGTVSRLPLQLEKTAKRFLDEVRRMKELYGQGSIGNVDEIFLTLKVEESKFFIPCGPMENALGTVIISCLANGQVLMPLLVLNGGKSCDRPTIVKRIAASRDGLLVLFSKDGIINSEVLGLWLQNVWNKCVKAPSLLLLDSFPCHQEENWQDLCNDEGLTVMLFPPGTACHKQPVDLCLKKFFLDEFRRKLLSLQPPNRSEKSKIEAISTAVNHAWKVVTSERRDLVRVTFEKLLEEEG